MRRQMIHKNTKLSLRHQCQLLQLNRGFMSYHPTVKEDSEISNELAAIYQENPVYGYRRLTACLRRQGNKINSKRVLRLMREMGIKAIYPGPRTTIVERSAHKYPYALTGMVVTKPNQAWQIDITYLRTDHGFIYLNALIDIYSRLIVGWSLSNTLETESCLRTLEKAIANQGIPDIINSDQGVQFTSEAWVTELTNQGILISMSGKGRSNDNAHIERLWRTLKYEWTYLNGCRSVADYKRLLPKFVEWYNFERPHQALNYLTPAEMLVNMSGEDEEKPYNLSSISMKPNSVYNQQGLS